VGESPTFTANNFSTKGDLSCACANLHDYQVQMNKTVDHLEEQLVGIRWGTITSGLVDTVRVSCYSGITELRYLASTQGDAKRIQVTPYDPALLGPINTALNDSGFNAYIFSKTSVVVNVPQRCGEEKDKVIKRVRKLGEEAKVSIRNIRKKARKECDDDDAIQRMTDASVSEVDRIVESKVSSM
jgi:ribosome recycling factor